MAPILTEILALKQTAEAANLDWQGSVNFQRNKFLQDPVRTEFWSDAALAFDLSVEIIDSGCGLECI